MSASKEIEPGARAMLLLATGLFRLDVSISGDTLRSIVRNLSPGQLSMSGRGGDPPAAFGCGDVAAYAPGQAKVEFALGEGEDRVEVEALIGTLKPPGRGVLRVSAQAIVRLARPS
jgi:hypothetical protein